MKQSYHLAQGEDPAAEEDASFKLCVCTMLLVLSLFGLLSIPLLSNSILGTKYTQGTWSDFAALERGRYETSNFPINSKMTEKSEIKSTLPNRFQPAHTTASGASVTKPTTTTEVNTRSAHEKWFSKTITNTKQINTEPTREQQILTSPQPELATLEAEVFKYSQFVKEKDNMVVTNTVENQTETDNIERTAKIKFTTEIHNYTFLVTSETAQDSDITSPFSIYENFTDLLENVNALTFTEETTMSASIPNKTTEAEHLSYSMTDKDSSTISSVENISHKIYDTNDYSLTTSLNDVQQYKSTKSIENEDQIITPTSQETIKYIKVTEKLEQFTTERKLASTTEVNKRELMKKTTTSVTEVNTTTINEGNSMSTNTEQISLSDTKTTTNTSLPSTCPDCPAVTCPVCRPSCPTTPTTSLPMTTKNIPADNECRTKQCFVMASRMLSLIDATADPCEDFYSFACGGLLNNPTLLEEDLSVDVLTRIKMAVKNVSSSSPVPYTKFKNFFDGCVNYDKLVSLEERKTQGREVLDSIGPFGTSSTETYDVTGLINMLFHHGSAPLFDVQFDVHSANSSLFQVVIKPPDILQLKFSFSSHFVSTEEQKQRCQPKGIAFFDLGTAYGAYQDCMINFTNFIETSIEALNFFRVFEKITPEEASLLLNEIHQTVEYILETLKELLHPQITQQDIQNKDFKPVSISELQEAIPMIEWATLFRGAVEDDADVANLFAQVYSMDYISALFNRLIEVSPRRIFNALLTIFAHDLYTDIVVRQHWSDREHYCTRVASNLMPVVASNLYLSTFTSDSEMKLRNQTHEVFEQLRATMKNKVSLAEWFDKKTLETVKEKLEFMIIKLPTAFSDISLISSLEECSLDSKQYIKDSICLLRQFQNQLYQRFSMDPHSDEAMWPHFLTAFSTKTAFIYNLNIFMVPFAVLSPLYNKKMPKHVVMARLGNLLARGIGHNFDPTGMKFSAGGRMGMILAEAANPSYDRVVEDSNVRYEYPKYHLEEGYSYSYTLSVITMLTLHERLSDMTAADLALSSIPDNDFVLPWVPFSYRQVYFLAIAQTFCTKRKVPETFSYLYEGTSLPPFERVNTLVSNLEPFTDAFKCVIGSRMNNMVKPRPFPMFEKVEYDTLSTS